MRAGWYTHIRTSPGSAEQETGEYEPRVSCSYQAIAPAVIMAVFRNRLRALGTTYHLFLLSKHRGMSVLSMSLHQQIIPS